MTCPQPAVVLTIGNFDGVHLGHQALLSRCAQLAQRTGVQSAALTFNPLPRELFKPHSAPARLQSLARRREAMLRCGVNDVIVQPFSMAFAQLSPADFVQTLLIDQLNVAELVVGWDFRFGQGRAGDVHSLRALLPITVHQLSAVSLNGAHISSTRIRALLADGAVDHCAALLGRPHSVSGHVARGHQRGRTLGFPTANLHAIEEAMPKAGVYAIWAELANGARHRGVVNIGTNPTFNNTAQSVEAHLLNFSGDLYEQPLRLHFVQRLRAERRFNTINALKEQLSADVCHAKTLLLSP